MTTNILIITVVCIAILIGLRFIHKIYPIQQMACGNKVKIYLNGFYNRTATISRNLPGGIVIYDKIMLPVHYRGRFYTIGYMDDGNKVMVVRSVGMAYLAFFAEIARKISNTPEFSDSTVELTEKTDEPKEEVQDGE